MGLSIGAWAAFGGIVFLAALVQGISGFAFGMVVLMVFPYIFGYTKSLILAALMAAVVMFYNAFLYRRNIDWRWVPRWMVPFIIADLISVLILKKVGDQPIWYLLMGIIFILMAIYLLWGQRVIHVKADKKSMVVLSTLSGLIMGGFGVGGPLMAAFFLEATDSKEDYLGTSQMVGGLTLSVDFITRTLNGMLSADVFTFTGLGIIFMAAGLLIAKRLVSRMDALTLRKFICVVMIVDGVVMLFH